MIKINLLVISFLLISLASFSQDEPDNAYIPSNFNSIKHYLSQINDKQLARVDGKYASKLKKIYKDRDVKMGKAIEDSLYFFHPTLKGHLDDILENIYASNQELVDPHDFYFFIKNSIIPNAGCYGDGSYEINLGLFTTYNSDDELAFVICHEIAHDILDHSYKNLSAIVSELNDSSTKEKIKKIEREEYGQTRAALALMDEINTDFLKHSKEVEAQADSLGFVLYQNTRYTPKLAIQALEKLEVTDGKFFDFKIKLDSIFNFKSYPFKEYWLEEEVSLFNTSEKLNDFSMPSELEKTHPEIDFRIEKIKKEFTISEEGQAESTHIEKINEIAAVQSITYAIDLKLLDLALYQLAQKFEEGAISSDFYYTNMAVVWVKIYSAKKNHELGKYVPRKNGFSDEKELNKIRLFLHSLELGEARNIGLAFCEQNKSLIKNNETFNQSFEFFKP